MLTAHLRGLALLRTGDRLPVDVDLRRARFGGGERDRESADSESDWESESEPEDDEIESRLRGQRRQVTQEYKPLRSA